MEEHTLRYLEKFCQMLESENLKCTKIRQSILKIFFSNTHLKVEDILKQLETEYTIQTSKQSIYATLKLLLSYKIIAKQTEDITYYELIRNSEHFHLVCKKCHKHFDFKDNTLLKLTDTLAKKNNFIIDNCTIVLYGLCSECKV